jgi:hypothetical protein
MTIMSNSDSGTIQVTKQDAANFDRVMSHRQMPADEIELCKQAYRRDPAASRISYAAMVRDLPTPEPDPETGWVSMRDMVIQAPKVKRA